METFTLAENNVGEVVDAILSGNGFSKIILLKGNLGSGKTTLAKKLIEQLGVTDTVTSPTFNIVSEYKTFKGANIYHFDLYRIKSADELYEIGFEEYIDSGNICIIEWPEIAEPLLPVNRKEVAIQMMDGLRKYDIISFY